MVQTNFITYTCFDRTIFKNFDVKNFNLDSRNLTNKHKFFGFFWRQKIRVKYSVRRTYLNGICAVQNSNDLSEFRKELDLTGDNGVIKTILKKGNQTTPFEKCSVKVHYKGELENGEVFDSSFERNEPYVFKIGDGNVIRGWEIGIKSMAIGEKSKFIISPNYGYKRKGIPPIIPPNAKLFFEIELLEILNLTDSAILNSSTIIQDIPRTPISIANEFEKKISKKAKLQKKKAFGNFFFISPFQSQTGEKAPWWLSPNITFLILFILILFLFYIVLAVGGIHQGYVEQN